MIRAYVISFIVFSVALSACRTEPRHVTDGAPPRRPIASDAASLSGARGPSGSLKTPREHYEAMLAAKQVRGATVVENPHDRVADFQLFTIDGKGGGPGTPIYPALVSPRGVLELQPDEWRAFLRAAPAAILARRIARIQDRGAAALLEPGRPSPSTRVDPREWALIAAPALETRPDGTLVFTAWYGSPPGFYPGRVSITVPPSGEVKWGRRWASALVAPDPNPAQTAIDGLLAASVDTVRWAIERVRVAKDKRAVKNLLKVLATHADLYVRGFAAVALGAIADSAAVPGLIRAARTDKETFPRSMAVQGLKHLRDASALRAIGELLDTDAARDVRIEAADALAAFGTVEAVAALERAASQNAMPEIRARAASHLRRLGPVGR